MKLLYNIGISCYRFGIGCATLWSPKATAWIEGRKNWRQNVADLPDDKWVWFHCSSLGEFEQGRTLIDLFYDETDFKVLLTFFSPSGYSIRSDYSKADAVLYLPLDTARNASFFLSSINIRLAIFVKYDLWYHYINQIQKNNIPIYLISAHFRSNQVYFSPFGGFLRKILLHFNAIFTIDEESVTRLENIGCKNVSVQGDTRMDRVGGIEPYKDELGIISHFKKGGGLVWICGSTWGEDEKMIHTISKSFDDLKIIIAPHDISTKRIQEISIRFENKVQKYSSYDFERSENHLIIDNIGLLSSLYPWGDFAYVGGGFGKSIHNILEPAAAGISVIFGPKHDKFPEGKLLIKSGGGFDVRNAFEMSEVVAALTESDKERNQAGEASISFVQRSKGASRRIFEIIKSDQSIKD